MTKPPKGRQRTKATLLLDPSGKIVHTPPTAEAKAEAEAAAGAAAEAAAAAAEAAKGAGAEAEEPQEVHEGVNCDSCKMKPIKGPCYRKQLEEDTEDYCLECYNKLDEEKKEGLTLVEIEKPKTADETLSAMAEWGTAECDNKEKLQLVRSTTKGSKENAVSVDVWHSLCLLVDAEKGTLQVYLDGNHVLSEEGLPAETLLLSPKLQLFGGGTAAQARGGDVRRLAVYNRVLSGPEVQSVVLECDSSLLEDAAPVYVPPIVEVADPLPDDYYDY